MECQIKYEILNLEIWSNASTIMSSKMPVGNIFREPIFVCLSIQELTCEKVDTGDINHIYVEFGHLGPQIKVKVKERKQTILVPRHQYFTFSLLLIRAKVILWSVSVQGQICKCLTFKDGPSTKSHFCFDYNSAETIFLEIF